MTTLIRWPWPADSREDRAKRVATSYRELLQRLSRGERDSAGQLLDVAGELYRLDQYWLQRAAYWAVPSYDPYDPDEWVNAADAAHYADVDPKTIRKWAERDEIRVDHTRDGTPIYNIGDLRAYDARKKQARLERGRVTSGRTC